MDTTIQTIIDFDAASAAWKANKIPKGNGTYTYKCCTILRNGSQCSLAAISKKDTCKRHLPKTI